MVPAGVRPEPYATAALDVDAAPPTIAARRRIGALRGGPAHPELEDRAPVRRLDDTCRLGGDERGEVELVSSGRLEQLGGGQRTLDDGDRGVGVDDAPSGTA